jgi:NitT/TauT family transport system ATP-binding protein
MNSTNILSIKNLSKTYHTSLGETLAIKDISFDIKKEEFIGIIGPSGCGKSSILNIISNLDKDYTGKILINNNIKIAYMLQEDALFPWLTIMDNVLLPLKIEKKLTKENMIYATTLLKKYGLYEFKDKYPSFLSGGMKQRVALIRTLALKPDILLLDEAFSALDYQTKIKVSQDVYNIIKNENKTAILVTHDISEAIRLCNRIIVLSNRPSKIINTYDINNNIDYHELIWNDLNE